jgi:hypothetical protein
VAKWTKKKVIAREKKKKKVNQRLTLTSIRTYPLHKLT